MKRIISFVHCGDCCNEIPAGESLQDYARYELGFSGDGFQVWCLRHDREVVHLNSDGFINDVDRPHVCYTCGTD
jgi:hypothetical protein